ncbi:MAG: hypothetical protein KAT07_01100 [Calditrichia bacterium]|nr:hypothetical protein [Calditrichia bacterium]
MKFFNIIKSLFTVSALGLLFLQCPPEVPDEIPPVVDIIHPVNGQAVSGTVQVSVVASDERDLKEIILFIDGHITVSSPGPLLDYNWDTAPIADDRNHSLYATATDASNNAGFSGSVVVRIVSGANPDTLPPVISILNPVTGSVVSDTVEVVSQVEDETGIDRVEYFVDGNLEYTATQEPYTFQWYVGTLPNGSAHSIFARAYDTNQNNSVSNTVSVTVQNTDMIAPTITILFPTTGATFFEGQVVSITAQAEDNIGVQRVDFFIDGELQFSDSTADYQFDWNTTGYGDNGLHTIFVKAFDFASNNGAQLINVTVASIPPDTTGPFITLLNPVGGSTVSDTVNVVPQITDESDIDRVEYFVDGMLDFVATQDPFEYEWIVTNYQNGSIHNIFGRAYDIYQNNGVSNVVSVNIQNTDIIPPSVLILFPVAGTSFTAGDTVDIAVEATDNIGIDRVEFYINGDLLFTDTTFPYRYNWDTTGYGTGREHTIYVKAFDFAQNSDAQLITVTVNP